MTPIPADVHVLVVDDIEQNRLALSALLARTGVKVLNASSGAQALELLLKHDVALALLDVQMPEMDGFALAELMRGTGRTRHIPIVFLTAASQDVQRTFRGYDAGAVDFLYKPIESHVLDSKVRVFADLYLQRKQLERQNDELQRILTLNDMVAAVLTHDMRTPLAAIVMNAEIVQMRGQEQALQKASARIKSSSARMVRLIEQLLDFSRIRSGAVGLDVQPADLQSVCAAVVKDALQMFPETAVDLQCQGDLRGEFDADRMTKAFASLIGNAMKYSSGERPVGVHLDGRDPDRLRVSVNNAGVLPDEMLQYLVGPLCSTQGKESIGLGLGLYIVDQFVRAHGGTITGRSNEDEGTVFEFSIPRRAADPV
jgi:signal transduction histidine kinase